MGFSFNFSGGGGRRIRLSGAKATKGTLALGIVFLLIGIAIAVIFGIGFSRDTKIYKDSKQTTAEVVGYQRSSKSYSGNSDYDTTFYTNDDYTYHIVYTFYNEYTSKYEYGKTNTAYGGSLLYKYYTGKKLKINYLENGSSIMSGELSVKGFIKSKGLFIGLFIGVGVLSIVSGIIMKLKNKKHNDILTGKIESKEYLANFQDAKYVMSVNDERLYKIIFTYTDEYGNIKTGETNKNYHSFEADAFRSMQSFKVLVAGNDFVISSEPTMNQINGAVPNSNFGQPFTQQYNQPSQQPEYTNPQSQYYQNLDTVQTTPQPQNPENLVVGESQQTLNQNVVNTQPQSNTQTKYCGYCGSQINTTDRVCPNCKNIQND